MVYKSFYPRFEFRRKGFDLEIVQNNLIAGISFLSPCRGGPPWSDFREISCFRCKVPQAHAIDQSTIKSACPGATTQENDPVSEIFSELGVYN